MFLSEIHLTKLFFLDFYDCVLSPTCQKNIYCFEISPHRCAIVVGDGGEGEGEGDEYRSICYDIHVAYRLIQHNRTFWG